MEVRKAIERGFSRLEDATRTKIAGERAERTSAGVEGAIRCDGADCDDFEASSPDMQRRGDRSDASGL